MTNPPSTSLDLLHDIATALEKDGPVEIDSMFRSPGLRVGDKVVAFLGRGDRLIVKLARPRAAALIEDGTAEPVTMGTRIMREWVAIPTRLDTESTRETWTAMAREALRFVRQSRE